MRGLITGSLAKDEDHCAATFWLMWRVTLQVFFPSPSSRTSFGFSTQWPIKTCLTLLKLCHVSVQRQKALLSLAANIIYFLRFSLNWGQDHTDLMDMTVGAIKSGMKTGSISEHIQLRFSAGFEHELKDWQRWHPWFWTEMKDKGFSPVLAKILCTGLTLNTC